MILCGMAACLTALLMLSLHVFFMLSLHIDCDLRVHYIINAKVVFQVAAQLSVGRRIYPWADTFIFVQ